MLFGHVDPKTRKRIYKKALLFLARKNGKTELCAAICLYCLLGLGKQGQEIYSCASDRKQAGRIFEAAATMIRNDAYLSSFCHIVTSQKRIVVPSTNNLYCALSADGFRQHGLSPSVVIFDELHTQKSHDLWTAMTSGFGARPERLTISITTAGSDQTSLCYEEYRYACQVRDGVIERPDYLPVIYEAEPKDDPFAESTWAKANPALGDFCEVDDLREQAQLAKDMPSRLNDFLQYRLNLWTNQAERWLPVDRWSSNVAEYGEDDLAGSTCVASLDLSSTRDLTCFLLLFKLQDNTYRILPYFFIPEVTARSKEAIEGTPFSAWERAGHVIFTEGETIDYDVVRDKIIELSELFNIQTIAADKWNATHLCQQLIDENLNVVWFRQGFISLNAPAKELERLIVRGEIEHNGNSCMDWMVSNVAVEKDAAGNIKPSKSKSTKQIDGVVCMCMALGLALENSQDSHSPDPTDCEMIYI